MAPVLVIYVFLVAVLAWAEFKDWRAAQYILKPAAALGFIIIALLPGAPESLFSQLILLGLMACAVGDVFLLSRKSKNLFLAGMAAFALGHIAYLSAFVWLPDEPYSVSRFIKTGLAIVFGGSVYAWLNPQLPKNMRIPVSLYSFIILLMVINALGLPTDGPLILATIGAVMFAVSDVFVAQDRFVTLRPRNALAITPLYFGGQALIALSMQAGI